MRRLTASASFAKTAEFQCSQRELDGRTSSAGCKDLRSVRISSSDRYRRPCADAQEADMSLLAEMVFWYRGRCGAPLRYIEDQSLTSHFGYRMPVSNGFVEFRGRAIVQDGRALLDLQLEEPGHRDEDSSAHISQSDCILSHVPAPKEVAKAIQEGTLTVGRSKHALTCSQISSYIISVQRALGLPRGIKGGWSDLAQERFDAWLKSKKKQRQGTAPETEELVPGAAASEMKNSDGERGSSSKSSSSSSDEEEDKESDEAVVKAASALH